MHLDEEEAEEEEEEEEEEATGLLEVASNQVSESILARTSKSGRSSTPIAPPPTKKTNSPRLRLVTIYLSIYLSIYISIYLSSESCV